MRCSISLDNASTIEDVVTAIRNWSQGDELMVAGDLNTDLTKPDGTARTEVIANTLASVGLEYMISHFPPRCKSWSRDGQTWSMKHRDWVVRSQTDSPLET